MLYSVVIRCLFWDTYKTNQRTVGAEIRIFRSVCKIARIDY